MGEINLKRHFEKSSMHFREAYTTKNILIKGADMQVKTTFNMLTTMIVSSYFSRIFSIMIFSGHRRPSVRGL